jgi:hypothetical protein
MQTWELAGNRDAKAGIGMYLPRIGVYDPGIGMHVTGIRTKHLGIGM